MMWKLSSPLPSFLTVEGHEFSREALAAMSPYRREHINRFADYTLNLDRTPQAYVNQ